MASTKHPTNDLPNVGDMMNITVVEHRADGSTVESSFAMPVTETTRAGMAAARAVTWCSCPADEQVPTYWQQRDGTHGWDCARCGHLLQVG